MVETKTLLKCSKREAIFRVKEKEQAKACRRTRLESEASYSSYPPDSPNRFPPQPTPRTMGKHMGKKYATKCLDKFVQSIDKLFDNQDNELYNQIRNLGVNFIDQNTSIRSSEVESDRDEN